jgi:dipeptidyl aminopeptidase/acylaminoacyl peptidase
MTAEPLPAEPLPVVPFGAWPSPIAASDLVSGTSQPTELVAEGGAVWWSQSRPDQGGRQQVLRRDADGTVRDVLPADWNARTRVHEYGGAAWWVHGGGVFTVAWPDQRLYRADAGLAPVALTPAPRTPAGLRYADGRVTPDGALVICVRESHPGEVGTEPGGQARNEIVAVSAVPSPGDGGDLPEPTVLVTGPDFVAAPRISPDGRRLAWIQWDHPNMPWDTTTLWVGDVVRGRTARGDDVSLAGVRAVAGRDGESLIQPEWGPDGSLYVVSDASDWWNVYRVAPEGLVPVFPVEAEIGQPAWVFGQSRYQVGAGTLWLTYSDDAGAHLVRVPTTTTGGDSDGKVRDDVLPWLALEALQLDTDTDSGADRLVAIAYQGDAEPAVVEIRDDAGRPAHRVLREPKETGVPAAAISRARRISFPSANGRTARGLLFLPASATVRGPDDELPPLMVTIHGGPTAGSSPAYRPGTQYWTTRGFAVVAVDYGGSTGYGRPYRRRLDRAWGIVDVEDACAAASYLADQGLVDGARLAIRGVSAGGFTTLAALATRDVFAAGASHFGVADLGALARDMHKFESRYLDGLIGPWPEAEDVYAERSPLSHIDGFDRPLIVLQGSEDAVVPPAQAELIVAALAAKHVPHAYLLFEGEQHGFRKAENIIRATEAELSFYGQVFGFEPAGDIEPVIIA